MAEIRFDADRCVGHALCNAVAPQVYELDDAGYLASEPTRVIDAALRVPAEAGARACPERALGVADNDTVTN